MKKRILSIALWMVMLTPLAFIAVYNHLPLLEKAAVLPDGLIIFCSILIAIGVAIFLESGERPHPLMQTDKEARNTRRPL